MTLGSMPPSRARIAASPMLDGLSSAVGHWLMVHAGHDRPRPWFLPGHVNLGRPGGTPTKYGRVCFVCPSRRSAVTRVPRPFEPRSATIAAREEAADACVALHEAEIVNQVPRPAKRSSLNTLVDQMDP
jgi:hypothetical protein